MQFERHSHGDFAVKAIAPVVVGAVLEDLAEKI
jgi:hypothetical protein